MWICGNSLCASNFLVRLFVLVAGARNTDKGVTVMKLGNALSWQCCINTRGGTVPNFPNAALVGL